MSDETNDNQQLADLLAGLLGDDAMMVVNNLELHDWHYTEDELRFQVRVHKSVDPARFIVTNCTVHRLEVSQPEDDDE